MSARRISSRGSDQFPVRFPEGMRDRIKADAEANGRSMNSEIVARLEAPSMTLRDYFAGQALVGMMQAMTPYSDLFERIAILAYAQADAMLAAREAKP